MSLYFRRTVPGAAHFKYLLGSFDRAGCFVVTRIQASVPDGTEITPPARVLIALTQVQTTVPGGKVLRSAPSFTVDIGKRCRKCNEVKSLGSFSIDASSADRRRPECRACSSAATIARRAITTIKTRRAA